MTRQPYLHASLPVLLQLDLQPVHLERSGIIRVVLASVDHYRLAGISSDIWRRLWETYVCLSHTNITY